jgi:hypothetical protein
MSMRIFFPVLAAAIAMGLSAADQQNAKLKIDVGNAPATDGRQMYASYCASCHGMDGWVSGEFAALLKMSPIDLIQLSKNNQGRHPAQHVIAVLQEGPTRQPTGRLWYLNGAPIFAKIDWSPSLASASPAKLLRISNLNRFIQGIQAN